MMFNLPFQTAKLCFGFSCNEDVAIIKSAWGATKPLGENSFFVVRASLPYGLRATPKTELKIKKLVSFVLFLAGVTETRTRSVLLLFERQKTSGLTIEPRVVTDALGNPLMPGRKVDACAA